jgi:hypothetical protein
MKIKLDIDIKWNKRMMDEMKNKINLKNDKKNSDQKSKDQVW